MQLPTFNSERLKKIKLKYVLAGLVLLILLIGGGVGLYLSGQSQDLRQQAAGGYLSCAGGVESGKKACSGFRAYVTCNNGAFSAPTTCSANQICQSGNCVAEAAQSCAGGVPNGARSCDTFRSYVTCNNGSFGASTPCTGNQTCSNGSCGGGGGGCPAGSNPITGGVDVGACRCTATGQVVEIGGSCNPVPSVVPGATPTASPTTGVCKGALESCDNGANACCGGLVCQGVDGNRKCQQQTVNQCGTGNTCGGSNGWLGFRCSSLSNGQCLENAQTFNSQSAAFAYANANGCGQVDEVCVGGPQNRNLCGSFQVISTSCGGTGGPSATPQSSAQPSPVASPTPGVTPSPVASPTPGVTPSPAVSPSPTPSPVCGTSCATTSQCPQDHTCNNGTCQLTACVNGAACDTQSCRVTACGTTCAVSADCPSDHGCNAGVCKLNACLNNSTCSSDFCRVTACGSTCNSTADCPNDHTCNSGVCKLNTCLNGATCDSNQCNVLTPSPVPSPVLGCNDVCVNNSDCKSSNQICVDTSSGRRCRLETNITSDSCSAPGQAVAASTPQPAQPTSLPVAGSSDILKALGIGLLAIILGVIGFLAL